MKRKRIKVKEFLDQVWPTPPEHELEAACDRVWMKLQEELKKVDTSLWSLEGDGWNAAATSQLEFQILSAASSLTDRADLQSIHRMVESWTGRNMIARVQSALEDVEKRGLVKVRRVRLTGSETQFLFDLTEDGDRAIRRAQAEGKKLMQAEDNFARGLAE
jgi:DNA-binding PadR family transcriptional regulator